MFQGVLYCATCSREADRARVETTAFKQSLAQGGLYSCAKCNQPVPLDDIRAGVVVYYQGTLSCKSCARDLRSILGRGPKGQTGKFKQSAVQAAAEAPPRASSSGQFPNPNAGGSQRMTANLGRGSGVAAALPSSTSGRSAPVVTPSSALPRPDAVQPGATQLFGRAGSISKRLGVPAEPPPVPCELCSTPVPASAVTEGKALVHEGLTYCSGCKGEVQQVLEMSKSSCEMLATFVCAACDKVVPSDDVLADKAIRYKGEIYCEGCKADLGRGKSSEKAGKPEKPAAVAAGLAVPCAKCNKNIPPTDVREKKALEVQGKLICRKCRKEYEEAQERRKKQAAKAIRCASCDRGITPKEIAEKRITQYQGNTYCGGCARDPAKILYGKKSMSETSDGVCRTCGGPSTSGPDCSKCQDKIAKLQEESLGASQELEARISATPCEGVGCSISISDADLLNGKAEVVSGKTLCAACAAKIRKGVAKCTRCRCPMPGAPAKLSSPLLCEKCLKESAADQEDAQSALALSGEVALSCNQCRKAISQEDLVKNRAASVGGKLLCASCKAKPAAVTPKAVAGKLCGTCDKPVGATGFTYAGKGFCAECKREFDKVLKNTALKDAATCTSCKKPASTNGQLVEGKAFCASCKRAAEYLVMYTVRTRRTKPVRAKSNVPWGLLGVLGVILALIGVVVVVRSQPDKPIVKPDVPIERPLSEGEIAAREARLLLLTPPATYEQAVATLGKLRAIADRAANDKIFGPQLAEEVKKLTQLKDDLGAGAVATVVDRANAVFAKSDEPGEAIGVLNSILPELLGTPQGVQAQELKARFEALSNCRLQARSLLVSTAPKRFEIMQQLLRSETAKRCKFPETSLGKQLEAEARVLELDWMAKGGDEKPPEKQPGAQDPGVARGESAEKVSNFALAENEYKAALGRDENCAGAILGMARIAIERDKLSELRTWASRGEVLARGTPRLAVIEAWLEFLSNKPDRYAKAEAILAKVAKNDLFKCGQRLKELLKAPPEILDLGFVRLHATASDEDAKESAKDLNAIAADVCKVLDLGAVDAKLDVFIFGDNMRSAFVQGLNVSAAAAGEGLLTGTFSIAPPSGTKKEVMRKILAQSLVARAAYAPAWLAVTLPDEITLGTQPPKPLPNFSFVALGKMNATAINGNPKALEMAQAVCSLVRSERGPDTLGRFMQLYKADPETTTREFETQVLNKKR